MIAAFATPQLAELETAIKASNAAAFGTAYRALTTGCNQRHQAIGHDFVAIKVPDGGAFPDQSFTAPRG